MKSRLLLTVAAAALAASAASAQVLATWTFETSVPTTVGPLTAEIGTGTATSNNLAPAVFSNPAGNGTLESWSGNTWAIGDYFEFSSSVTASPVQGIQLTWSQTSSNTGPRDWEVFYQVNAGGFTSLGLYTVLGNGVAPNASWNSTTSSAAYTFGDSVMVNLPSGNHTIDFRLVVASAIAVNGSAVATGGTSRVDTVSIEVIPEPSTYAAIGGALALVGAVVLRRRRA